MATTKIDLGQVVPTNHYADIYFSPTATPLVGASNLYSTKTWASFKNFKDSSDEEAFEIASYTTDEGETISTVKFKKNGTVKVTLNGGIRATVSGERDDIWAGVEPYFFEAGKTPSTTSGTQFAYGVTPSYLMNNAENGLHACCITRVTEGEQVMFRVLACVPYGSTYTGKVVLSSTVYFEYLSIS